MRIITGVAKGKRLRAPRGMKTRPTLGRARETLFNILTPRIVGAKFLDLFAGTGSVGIEALSRGAEFAMFVENDERAVHALRENLRNAGLQDKSQVLRMSVMRAIPWLAEKQQAFDVVFSDPPYERDWTRRTVDLLEVHPDLLKADGWFIAQQHHKEPVIVSQYFAEFRQKQIGDTRFVFYGRRPDS